MFGAELVEVLLSAILMLNVGAYSFLWYKIRRVEGKMESLREEKDRIERSIGELWNRIFGHSEDDTSGGHLQETENQFDEFEKSLDDISQQIDDIDAKRQREHEKVQEQMREMVWTLSSEEHIDIEKEEFDF